MKNLTAFKVAAILAVIVAITHYILVELGVFRYLLVSAYYVNFSIQGLLVTTATYLAVRAFFIKHINKVMSIALLMSIIMFGVFCMVNLDSPYYIHRICYTLMHIVVGLVFSYFPRIKITDHTDILLPCNASKNVVSKKLKLYLDYTILPHYDEYDKGHNREHIVEVANGVLELAEGQNVDCDMLYTAAIFHDLGLCEGRDNHHIISAVLLRDDSFIKEFFTAEQIDIIAEAIEDHRASAKRPPRSIYGKILSSADRIIDPDRIILRSYYHSLDHYPELTLEGHIDRVYSHIIEKYGENGYMKIPILTERNKEELARLRGVIADEVVFKKYLCKVINIK